MDKSGKSLQEVCAQDATVPTQLMNPTHQELYTLIRAALVSAVMNSHIWAPADWPISLILSNNGRGPVLQIITVFASQGILT